MGIEKENCFHQQTHFTVLMQLQNLNCFINWIEKGSFLKKTWSDLIDKGMQFSLIARISKSWLFMNIQRWSVCGKRPSIFRDPVMERLVLDNLTSKRYLFISFIKDWVIDASLLSQFMTFLKLKARRGLPFCSNASHSYLSISRKWCYHY